MKEKKPLKVVSVDPIEGTIIDYYKKIMENVEIEDINEEKVKK